MKRYQNGGRGPVLGDNEGENAPINTQVGDSDIANVWVVELDSLNEAGLARCDWVISPTERDRIQRFHFAQDRDTYRAAHVLARLALSSCAADVPPQAWVFETTTHGRPEIAAGHRLPRLRFNISHTRRVVACIVTRDPDCGVDVELTHCCSDVNVLACTVLAPSELAAISAVPEAERAGLFYRYWTLKEAFAKALGLGMSLAFDSIAFELCAGPVRLHPPSDEWHFEQWSPTPMHILAIVVRAPGPVRVIRHCAMPHHILNEIEINA